MKKTVFLDLGNVLVQVKKEIAFREIGRLVKSDTEKIKEQIDWALEQNYETGKITTSQYIQALNKKYGDTQIFNFENLCDIWAKGFEAIDSAIKLLPQLQKKVNLYLLSNTNKIHFTAIEQKFQISKYFCGKILSYEVGLCKPNLSIYRKALEIAGTEGENSYFIDDLEENLGAAQKLGIHCHQYKQSNSFRNFVSKYSLL